MQFDLIVVGHFAIDKIETKEDRQIIRLGGAPFYSAVAASRLGAKVAVLSKVGGDFTEKYLKILENENINVSFIKVIKEVETTSFRIKYLNSRRKMRLEVLSPKILVEDVPANVKAKVVHVAPIVNEIPYETFEKLQEIADIICLDPQGYVRELDKEGYVKLKKWRDERFLRKISIFKSDAEEAVYVSGISDLQKAMRKIAEYGVEVVLVTMGNKGSAIFYQGKFQKIPAYPAKRVADPTGAGDVFIGTYLAEHIKGREPIWCACVGSAAASFIVEKTGLLRFGFKDEVYARASELYEKFSL